MSSASGALAEERPHLGRIVARSPAPQGLPDDASSLPQESGREAGTGFNPTSPARSRPTSSGRCSSPSAGRSRPLSAGRSHRPPSAGRSSQHGGSRHPGMPQRGEGGEEEPQPVHLRFRIVEVLPDISRQRRSLPKVLPHGAEKLVVCEYDFRRYGNDLEMLRRCQVPRWVSPPPKPLEEMLSYADKFEQSCRSYAELLDPWINIKEPHQIQQSSEGDMTLNQVWVPPTYEETQAQARSHSEDAPNRIIALQNARRKLALIGSMGVARADPWDSQHSMREYSRGRASHVGSSDAPTIQKAQVVESAHQYSLEKRGLDKKSMGCAGSRLSSHDESSTTCGLSRTTSVCRTDTSADHSVRHGSRHPSLSATCGSNASDRDQIDTHETKNGCEWHIDPHNVEGWEVSALIAGGSRCPSREGRSVARDRPPRAPSKQMVAPVGNTLLAPATHSSIPPSDATTALVAQPVRASHVAPTNLLPPVERAERPPPKVAARARSLGVRRGSPPPEAGRTSSRPTSVAASDARSSSRRRGSIPEAQLPPRPPNTASSTATSHGRGNRRSWH